MPHDKFNNYLQGRASPGVSPVTQSSESPSNLQHPGGLNGEPQQFSQGPIPQRYQAPQGVVQIATAVPIRQVERSPNGNPENTSGQNSPEGDQGRGRSSSVVNQIEVGRGKPTAEQGRNRAASHSAPQQHPVHIASLQAPVSKPVGSTFTNGIEPGPQDDGLHIDPQRSGNPGRQTTSQPSPQPRRVSTNLLATQNQSGSHSTPSTSPAPSYELPASPPGVPENQQPTSTTQQPERQVPQEIRPSHQAQQSSNPPQPSVYRPSGPQIAAGTQPVMPSQTRVWSTGQNNNGRGSPVPLPAQYSMQGRPPQDLMTMTSAYQEQRSDKEGSFSKFITKSKTFVQDIGPLSTEKLKGDKESKREKLMSAFKKPKQQHEAPRPSPQGPPPGGPGPDWIAPSAPSQTSPKLERLPQNATEQQPLVTRGVQAMPSKAASLLGQPPNAMFESPTDQELPKPRSQHERSNSQPYLNYQDERQVPGKTTPPLSPDEIQGARPAAPSASSIQPPQSSSGRPSISSLPPNQGPQKVLPQTQTQRQQQASPNSQQQQQYTAPRQSAPDHKPTTAPIAANNRAPHQKEQTKSHNPEPQYAEVPIPQGYALVLGAQTSAPRPTASQPPFTQPYQMTPNVPYQGQPPQQPLQQQAPQQWIHPAMMQPPIPGQLPMQVPQAVWAQYPQYQGTPPPIMYPYQQPPPQQYIQGPHATPSPPVQGQASPPGVLMQQPVQQQIWQQQPSIAPIPQQYQHVQAFPQQITPPQSGGFVPPQQTSIPASELAQPTPTSASAPAHRQFSVVTEVAPVPAASHENAVQPQIHSPAPIKPQPTSPPQQTVPRSAFAIQSLPEQGQLLPNQSTHGNSVPQRQISAASEVSSLVTEPASQVSADTPRMQSSQLEQQQTPEVVVRQSPMLAGSPTHQRAPVTLRDDPVPPKVDTPVTATPAEQDEKDDIYGATPRLPAESTPKASPHEQQHTFEHIVIVSPSPNHEPNSKFAGMPDSKPAETTRSENRVESTSSPPPSQQSFSIMAAPPIIIEPQPTSAVSSSSPATAPSPSPSAGVVSRSKSPLLDDEPPSPTASELGEKKGSPSTDDDVDDSNGAPAENGDGGKGTATINGKPVQSSQEIFEEHKRKQLLRDMEEKIAIMPTEMEPEPINRRRNDDLPIMSATSYPGQEWNPYGDGFEDFED